MSTSCWAAWSSPQQASLKALGISLPFLFFTETGLLWNGWKPLPPLQGKWPCCSCQPYEIPLSRGLWIWESRVANVAACAQDEIKYGLWYFSPFISASYSLVEPEVGSGPAPCISWSTSLCCGRCPSFNQGPLPWADVTAHLWLSLCSKHPSADSCTPGLSLLTELPMQRCLFLPLSAGAAGPPELLALFTHCQCFLLRKYVPIRLCSWGICFLFYLLLFPSPHLLIPLSTQWPNNSQGDK